MSVFLFDKIIFGPVKSRRLGVSLGINLLPTDSKICNFNCIYCECGWNRRGETGQLFPSVAQVVEALSIKLNEMKQMDMLPDAITFAGNGEPTLHPKFENIIDETIRLRNQYAPNCTIACLSNSTLLSQDSVFSALNKLDKPILKLDSAIEQTIRVLNKPADNFSLESLREIFLKFNGNFILQTMFVKGNYKGQDFDNSTPLEVDTWLTFIQEIKPKQLMIYTIARDTPIESIEKIGKTRLNEIAEMVEGLGINVQVSG